MELDQIQQRYLYVIKQGITGALETSVPLRGWEHNREQDGFGRGVPESARTMIGEARLDNIRACIEEIVTDKVPGDLIELGCWRGGAGIFMKACLNVCEGDNSTRQIWLADTFPDYQPVSPPPLPIRLLLCAVIRVTMYLPLKYRRKAVTTAFQDNFPEEEYSEETIDHFLKTLYRHNAAPKAPVRDDLDDVQEAFRRYDLLDEQVKFLRGWFADTLHEAPIKQLALLRLDADFYRSTMDGLQLAYHKLSPGGFCIVDDYGAFPECRRAVDEFRETHAITEAIEPVDTECVFWKKT